MLIFLATAVLALDMLGGTPVRAGLLAGQLIGGWKAEKERDQFKEACREGFNPVRQSMTNERWKKVWKKVGPGPVYSIPLSYSQIYPTDLIEAREAVRAQYPEEDLLSIEEIHFLVGEYLLTEEEVFLFDQGVKAHIRRVQHPVDFWWLQQVSKFRMSNTERAALVDEMRRQDTEARRSK